MMAYDMNLFFGGIVIGLVLTGIWAYLRYSDLNFRSDREEEGEKDKGKVKGPITLEHYHWGLIAIGLALRFPEFGVLEGVFITLFAVETLQKHPFGLGKKHFTETTLLGLLILILIVFTFL